MIVTLLVTRLPEWYTAREDARRYPAVTPCHPLAVTLAVIPSPSLSPWL